MATIPQLEKAFSKKIGYPYGLYQSTTRGNRRIMGKHLSVYVPLQHTKAAKASLEQMKATVERYYGKVKKVVYRQAGTTGYPVNSGEAFRTFDFVFDERK